MRFAGHESDVNAVHFFPTGEALGTACSDGSVSGRGVVGTGLMQKKYVVLHCTSETRNFTSIHGVVSRMDACTVVSRCNVPFFAT